MGIWSWRRRYFYKLGWRLIQKTLKEAAEQLKASLSSYQEISALEDTQGYDKTEYIITLTNRGKKLGFTIDSVGRQLSDRLNGIETLTFLKGNKTGKIIIELSKKNLKGDFIQNAKVRSNRGHYGSLSDIVEIKGTVWIFICNQGRWAKDNNSHRTIVSEEDAEQAEIVKDRIQTKFCQQSKRGLA